MTSGVAVFDASPLIAFDQIGQLDLIHALFLHSLVPMIVAHEVAPSLGVLPSWIESRDALVMPALSRTVDAGERAAIALAIQLSADFVVLDDLAGRVAATELGLTAIGSLGLLVRAKRRGLIRVVRPMMDAMVAQGLFVSEKLRREILEVAGETDV